MDDAPVGTELIVGPKAKKPLRLSTPIFISDMSFGVLSEEAKVALAMGTEMAGTALPRAKAACCPKSRRPIRDTSMN